MGIIYKTTNVINGKIYIGKSKLNDSSYLGSGMILKQAIEKYGHQSFTKEILEECPNSRMDDREKYWIDKYESQNRNIGYNIADGGTGGDTTTNHPNKDLIVAKRSQSLREWHQSLTDEEKITRGRKIGASKKGKSNGREGLNHSPETIEKIRTNQPSKTEDWVNSHGVAMGKRRGQPLVKKRKSVVVDGVEFKSVKEAIEYLGLKHRKYFYDMIKQGKLNVEYK